jgi:hypothetical protein
MFLIVSGVHVLREAVYGRVLHDKNSVVKNSKKKCSEYTGDVEKADN